jgi:regulator of sirC expression with transglutaminase-like and TPR domain
MSEPHDLVLFAHLARKPDSELDLERAALLVAETEYPGLDVASYIAKLDGLGQLARQRLKSLGLEPSSAGFVHAEAMNAILRLLYQELGFRGNVSDYYDPRNSFLNDVIDRRTGIPITLAIVLVGVCRRAGVDAVGLSFPGHFLVRTKRRGGEPMYVDPFDGRRWSPSQLQALYESATGDPGEIDERFLEPARRRQIVARMLNNLRAIYEVRGDRDRLQRVLERMTVVSPSEEGPQPPRPPGAQRRAPAARQRQLIEKSASSAGRKVSRPGGAPSCSGRMPSR